MLWIHKNKLAVNFSKQKIFEKIHQLIKKNKRSKKWKDNFLLFQKAKRTKEELSKEKTIRNSWTPLFIKNKKSKQINKVTKKMIKKGKTHHLFINKLNKIWKKGRHKMFLIILKCQKLKVAVWKEKKSQINLKVTLKKAVMTTKKLKFLMRNII